MLGDSAMPTIAKTAAATPTRRRPRRIATLLVATPIVAALTLILAGTIEARACTVGDETCPVVLHMKKGAVSVTGTGVVSGTRPNFYFEFNARAGQKMAVKVVGGGIKTGPGIPITLPNGGSDAVDVDTPYTLPATGDYIIVMHANTMSDGPFGRFFMTLTIK
jgi:hypothetical protein